MFEVLVPLDRDEARTRAQVDAVASLPNENGEVSAVLMHVFDDADEAESTGVRQLANGRVAYDALTEANVTTDTVTVQGEPAEQIRQVADERDVDMIVLGGRKRSTIGSLLFGSVSKSVSLETDRPVLITGDAPEETDEEPTTAT